MPNFASSLAALRPADRAAIPLIAYNGTDISATLYPYIMSVQWHQTYADSFDSIAIKLADPYSKFSATVWKFETSQMITLSIRTQNWRFPGDSQVVACGNFLIEEIQTSFPPSFFTVRACVGLAISKAKWSNFYQIWGGTLGSIAAAIAQKDGVGLKTYPSNLNLNIPIGSAAQENESDVVFLSRLCHQVYLNFKPTADSYWIFDEMALDQKAPAFSIVKPVPGVPGGTGMGIKAAALRKSIQNNNFVMENGKGQYIDVRTGKVISTVGSSQTLDQSAIAPQAGITTAPGQDPFAAQYGPAKTLTQKPLLPGTANPAD